MVEKILPLKIENASVTKRGMQILKSISLEISQGGLTVIMGPNGSGKTTLLKMMHGLEKPRQGTIHWNCDLETVRLNQSYVFQTPILLRRTTLENIIYPLRLRGISKNEAKHIAYKWIEQIKLKASANLNASLLSGGEKQKLAIARALATNPQLLFLDEPTTNLDGTSTREIETLLVEAQKSGMRIIMTTHDLGQAKRLAHDVIFLYRGAIHETGIAKTFLNHPKTNEAKAFLQGDILE